MLATWDWRCAAPRSGSPITSMRITRWPFSRHDATLTNANPATTAAPCRCDGRVVAGRGLRAGRVGGTVSGSVCGAALLVIFWRSPGRAAG